MDDQVCWSGNTKCWHEACHQASCTIHPIPYYTLFDCTRKPELQMSGWRPFLLDAIVIISSRTSCPASHPAGWFQCSCLFNAWRTNHWALLENAILQSYMLDATDDASSSFPFLPPLSPPPAPKPLPVSPATAAAASASMSPGLPPANHEHHTEVVTKRPHHLMHSCYLCWSLTTWACMLIVPGTCSMAREWCFELPSNLHWSCIHSIIYVYNKNAFECTLIKFGDAFGASPVTPHLHRPCPL